MLGWERWKTAAGLFFFFFLHTHTLNTFQLLSEQFSPTYFPRRSSAFYDAIFDAQHSCERSSSIHSYISCAINRQLMRFLFCVTQIFYKIRKQAHKYLTEPVFGWGSSLCQITCRNEDSHFFFYFTSRCVLVDKKAGKRGHTTAIPTRFDWKWYFFYFSSSLYCLDRDSKARCVNQKPLWPAEVLNQPPPAESRRLIDKGGLREGQPDTAPAMFPCLSDTFSD